ncbi:AAA family ATPase [Sporolactobacillus pectinivorans]|uniref:AAA family ATPase n=1 Tax=Sporolactobacillus pectinivorans TaxID=1591408 RepID=UPI000C26C01D|nr:ATP-binding protein [Sporolactobacillus pectinivorans]
MLIMFKAKNYTSFKDEVILDLRATSYKQHPNHVLDVSENLKLLKTAAIYGANASGKSNLVSAMFFFEQYIFEQFINKQENENIDFAEKKLKIKMEPFLLTDQVNDASEFDIIFFHNGKQIQYGFECSAKEVLNEWYFIDDKKVFEREKGTVSFGKNYTKILKPYTKVPSERLYLSVLEYFLEDEGKERVLNDFIDFFTNEYNVYLEILFESSVKKVAGAIHINKKLVTSKEFRSKVENYLCKIDVGICGLDVQIKTIMDEDSGKEKKKKVIKTIHNVFNADGDIVGQRSFDLLQESTGTLRFLSYIQNVIEMTEQGCVFIVDEISARLHPLLTKLIVDIFQSSQNKKAQLIFTTHDISLMNKEQFRRDEIFFVEKNEKGESTLHALSDLNVREDATFNKSYLQGKYGGIPVFHFENIISGAEHGKN